MIFNSDPPIPNIPNYNVLLNLFPKEECEILNWYSAAITFPKFVQLIEFPVFSYNLLLGLVSSVGGLTETLVS